MRTIEEINKEYAWNEQKIQKMYTYLKGFCYGAGLKEASRALVYAREKHAGQFRDNGVPYIVHPLSMMYYTVRSGIKDDNILSVMALHDVVEDCNVPAKLLPFNDTIITGVEYMTVEPYENEDKIITKERYYNELIKSREAIVGKGVDKLVNMADSEGNISDERIVKNVKEVDTMLLDKLKEAEFLYDDVANFLFVVRTNLKYINRILGIVHNVYGQ